MTAKEMKDNDFIKFQDDFYELLEKYGVSKIDIEHPLFNAICYLRKQRTQIKEPEMFTHD